MKLNNRFNRLILLFGLLFISYIANAQLNIYIVKLKDKANSPYSTSRPSEFLTQKAIDRRQLQHINLSTEDLPINPSYKNGITSLGVKVRLELKWFNTLIIQSTSDKIPLVLALGFVSSVESIGPIPSLFQATVKPFFKNETTGNPRFKDATITNDYGPAKAQIEQVEGHLLHNLNLLGQGMTIAVLDAGYRNFYTLAVFDSLRLNGRLKGVHDFTYMPNFMSALDDNHGTEVLSIMAGSLNNARIGTAPYANYYLLRTEDPTSESPIEEYNWAAGAAYADSVGADIISSSLGYNIFDASYFRYNLTYNDLNGHTAIISRAAAKAAAKGIIVVNAAGNEGDNGWRNITAPADADSIIAVGAVNLTGVPTDFTSHGPSSDGRIKPDIAACGSGVIIANPVSNGLLSGNGTSFSTPIIAGLCACLWQGNPGASNLDLISALKFTASRSANPDTLIGYGIANFYKAYLLLKKQQTKTTDKPIYLMSPNPFHDHLQMIITSPSISGWTLDLYSIQGKLVEHFGNVSPNHPILIGNRIKSGTYLLRIFSESQIAVEKVIKN